MSKSNGFSSKISPPFSLSLILGLTLSCVTGVANSSNATSSYVQLLDAVQQHLPEAMKQPATQSLLNANKALSTSWLAGDVSVQLEHENDALTGRDESQSWSVGAQFPVWFPSQKSSFEGVTSAYQQKLSAHSGYLNWLASDILRNLAWESKKATIEVNLAKSALTQSRSLAAKVEQKVKVGESTQLDLLLAEKAVLKHRTQLVKKQGQLKTLKLSFIGWTQSTRLPVDIKEKILSVKSISLHPQLIWLTASLTIENAKLLQQKQQNQSSPSLYIGAKNDQSSNVSNTSLVFGVSIPLGIGHTNKVIVAQKQLAVSDKRAALKQAEFVIKRNIREATQQLATQTLQGQLVKQQSVLDHKALSLAEKSYQYGASTLQDLLLIQQQALASQLNLELTNANLGQSIAHLNHVMGYALSDDSLRTTSSVTSAATLEKGFKNGQ